MPDITPLVNALAAIRDSIDPKLPEPCASCIDTEADCQECPYWDDDEPTEPRIPPFVLFKRTPTRSEH